MSRQRGLVTRRQAQRASMTERELRTATAVHGPWVVVRRGVYCVREVWEAAAREYDGRGRLLDLAAHLSMPTDHLMSHDSAARALGIPMLRPELELSHVTRLGVGGSRTEHGVRHHLTRLCLLGTLRADGMPTTSLARTALDLAREHGLETGVMACDHVLGMGVEEDDLDAELLAMWCWPNITRARAAREKCRLGADSGGESLLRLVVEALDLGEVETQFPVPLPGGRTAWADLRVGRQLFEFDGRGKFLRTEQGGYADRPIDQVAWDERQRQLEICEHGLGLSRAHWPELFGRQRALLRERLLRESAVTATSYGMVLPAYLQEYAARMAPERRRRMLRRQLRPSA